MPDEIPNPPTADDPAVAITHLLAYNETADYGPESDEPERSGREAMALYQQAASGIALEQGVGPTWFNSRASIGDGREWDEFRINVFPSHAAFDVVMADTTRIAGQVHRQAVDRRHLHDSQQHHHQHPWPIERRGAVYLRLAQHRAEALLPALDQVVVVCIVLSEDALHR